MSEPKCGKCKTPIAMQARECDVCGRDAGFPNVRRAERLVETKALAARSTSAEASAAARGVGGELQAFRQAVGDSVAVMNRSLGSLSEWINGSSDLFLSFHKQVHLLKRHPQENEWDPQREAAESAINPYSFQEINFAALSLDGTGMTYYGDYAVTLSTFAIEDRSSVFEENPFNFNRNHHITSGKPVPHGYRAAWGERGQLAAAKLHGAIKPGMSAPDFPTLLMEDRRDESDCDFVEVHIYGDVNRKGIQRVIGAQAEKRRHRTILRQATNKLTKLGVTVEIAG